MCERVWCTTQLAKLSFNHSNGRTHSWRFSTFCKKWNNVSCEYDRVNGWKNMFTADVLQYFYELILYRSYSQLTFTIQTVVLKIYIFWGSWKTSAVSTTSLNGWNSTLQAAWYIRHVRVIWFLWTKPTICLLILSIHKISSARFLCLVMKDIGRWLPWMLPGSSRTIVNNHYVHWYCITLVKGRDYIKHDNINARHGKQNPRRGRLKNVSCEYDRLIEWLKLNFASCVVHQTRSCNTVFVN